MVNAPKAKRAPKAKKGVADASASTTPAVPKVPKVKAPPKEPRVMSEKAKAALVEYKRLYKAHDPSVWPRVSKRERVGLMGQINPTKKYFVTRIKNRFASLPKASRFFRRKPRVAERTAVYLQGILDSMSESWVKHAVVEQTHFNTKFPKQAPTNPNMLDSRSFQRALIKFPGLAEHMSVVADEASTLFKEEKVETANYQKVGRNFEAREAKKYRAQEAKKQAKKLANAVPEGEQLLREQVTAESAALDAKKALLKAKKEIRKLTAQVKATEAVAR